MIYRYEGHDPRIDPSAYIAPNAQIIGKVTIAAQSSIWFNCVLRGDNAPIHIGRGSNIQDAAVVHVNPGQPVLIGDEVSVGHSAIIHACTIGSRVLIGMGAIILDDAEIGDYVLIGAGTLIPPGKKIPSGTLVMGNPYKVVRELGAADLERISHTFEHYVKQGETYIRNGIV